MQQHVSRISNDANQLQYLFYSTISTNGRIVEIYIKMVENFATQTTNKKLKKMIWMHLSLSLSLYDPFLFMRYQRIV